MGGRVRLVAWTLRHGRGDPADLASAILELQPNLLVLTEYRHSPSYSLATELEGRGWTVFLSSCEAGKNSVLLGTTLAPASVQPFAAPSAEFAARWLLAEVAGVRVAAVSVPSSKGGLERQERFSGWLRALVAVSRLDLLAGDFRVQGNRSPASTGLLRELAQDGWRDPHASRASTDDDPPPDRILVRESVAVRVVGAAIVDRIGPYVFAATSDKSTADPLSDRRALAVDLGLRA